MAMLAGQVYQGAIVVNQSTQKKSFKFNLAHRKAFGSETPQQPNLFTRCVAYSDGLAEKLNEHFGGEENNGAGVILFGHYDEYEWYPDANNQNHARFFDEVTIDAGLMQRAGVVLGEGSVQEFVVRVPQKQTTRQFVVTGFEFSGHSRTYSRPTTQATRPTVTVAGTKQAGPLPQQTPATNQAPAATQTATAAPAPQQQASGPVHQPVVAGQPIANGDIPF